MGNLRITLFALLLVVWPTNTNPHQARIKDSDSAIVVVSRRVNGQVVRLIAAGQQHKQDALTESSDLCREPGRNHNVVSWIDDSNNVADLFDALKWIEQAKCDGSIGTIVWHEGKGYNMPPSIEKGLQGKNTVEFRTLRDGNIQKNSLKMIASSQKSELDTASLGAVREAAPFGHLPENFSEPFIVLRMTFYYNLASLMEPKKSQ